MSKPCEHDQPVMVEIQGVYDGALFFECMVCSHRWHRFSPDHYLWKRAEPYVQMHKDY